MRLVGVSFAERKEQSENDFAAVLHRATALLKGAACCWKADQQRTACPASRLDLAR